MLYAHRSRALPGVLMLALAGGAVAGCNEAPVEGVIDTLTVQIKDSLRNPGQVKLDILWVIDNSVSMCQEQNGLAENIDTFLKKFQAFDLDLKMAVVTTDALSESEQGAFHCEIAPPFPPNCLEKRAVKCLQEADCSNLFGPGWVCEAPNGGAANLQNFNCSINSRCRYACDGDASCIDQFGVEDYVCKAPGGDVSAKGCLRPPATQDCPSELPCVMSTEAGNLGVFKCVAIVGALQDSNPQLEQGLNVAVWALERNPEPGCPDRSLQAKDFLRDDAYQVIIFVTDEEDCSLAKKIALKKEDWNKCSCLPTTDEGGPLEPIDTFVNKLKSINRDPSKVLVAAIVGDVIVADTPDELDCLSCEADDPDLSQCIEDRRKAFRESKCKAGPYAQNSYVCESPAGIADWGSRYLELVKRFDKNGVAANICNNEGFGPALDQVSSKILTRVARVCLPKPVKPGTPLHVSRVSPNGTSTPLEEGAADGYFVEPASDCPPHGDSSGKAVFLSQVLQPGEQVEVRYQAPLVLTP